MNSISRRNLNATLGILGIFSIGIFLDWFPKAFLQIPMPSDFIWNTIANSLWQIMATIVLPCAWAMHRLGFSLKDLGLGTHNFLKTALYGCALYSLALAAFIYCSADPLISNHAVGKLDFGDAMLMLTGMSLIAATTDIATRGFILLTLARYAPVSFAILIQNLVWYLGHVHEIKLLTNCLGYGMAVALTLTLGILGDIIALKTRNVLGLAFAHIMLNLALTIYIRQM